MAQAIRVTAVAAALAACAGLAGCVPATAMHGQRLRQRAAVDLRCPERELFVETVDQKTGSVQGCGRHATYALDHQGTWVLQSAGGRAP
jgi:hypothetical protein